MTESKEMLIIGDDLLEKSVVVWKLEFRKIVENYQQVFVDEVVFSQNDDEVIVSVDYTESGRKHRFDFRYSQTKKEDRDLFVIRVEQEWNKIYSKAMQNNINKS